MKLRWIMLATAGLVLAGLSSPAAEITDKEAADLIQELQPNADEAWRTIPWQISLLEAQRAAAQEKKPIFIWAMDGHPLGCT